MTEQTRTGRPPLTERRKAETRLEVAHAAVELYLAKGLANTTADEIAAAVGISTRTLWRYFPTKESFVMPLLAGGIENVAERLRSWGRDQGPAELVELLSPLSPLPDSNFPTVRELLRLSQTEPGLRAVWLEAHRNAEPEFARALADRAGLKEPDLTCSVQAGMINVALRVAVEHCAFHTDATVATYHNSIRAAVTVAVSGFPASKE
ncbi:TetR/AcrR family transcriptional regulator [Kutzneria sp. NPDC052558]|uniref:TetR/AcrR family transcriptional regulator n=1 Tax=Kutzneria sp. NPDC052558 TaxID=3364121 RepID=UPI0037C861C5